MKITGNESANPFFKWNESGYGDTIVVYDSGGGKQFFPYEPGLTIRQHFACQAMQAILRTASDTNLKLGIAQPIISTLAVKYADMLIEELNKTEK
jgi:hypothetical protein